MAVTLGDMDDDLSEEDIVRRKTEAINAMVAYSRICEPPQREQPELKTKEGPGPVTIAIPYDRARDTIRHRPNTRDATSFGATHPTSASRSTVPHSRHSDARHRLGSATPI